MRAVRGNLHRLAAAAIAGGAAAAGGSSCSRTTDEDTISQLQRQADKARRRAQERVLLGRHVMLGMTPKLWLEALDEEHRYGSMLHHYWQRWEASRTRWMFFDWLDDGRGALIDLPTCPRRLLEEGKVIYLTREQLKLCEVQIERGRLHWCADGEPVTLPLPAVVDDAALEPTARARSITAVIEERLTTTRRRERMLREARAAVMDAIERELPPTADALKALTSALISEGLLRQLRDPFYQASLTRPLSTNLLSRPTAF